MSRGGARNNSGRKPKPQALHDLHGTKSGAMVAKDQVLLKAKDVKCPDWISGHSVAVEAWNYCLKALEENNRLTYAVLLTVGEFAKTYSKLRDAWTDYEDGETNFTPVNQLLNHYHKFSAELGLDPMNLARLPGNRGDPKDGIGSFLE